MIVRDTVHTCPVLLEVCCRRPVPSEHKELLAVGARPVCGKRDLARAAYELATRAESLS
jgi:hypothetical protein